jgi:hypothetical protein
MQDIHFYYYYYYYYFLIHELLGVNEKSKQNTYIAIFDDLKVSLQNP